MTIEILQAQGNRGVELPHPYSKPILCIDLTREQRKEARRMDSLASSLLNVVDSDTTNWKKLLELFGDDDVRSRASLRDKAIEALGEDTVRQAYVLEAKNVKAAAREEISIADEVSVTSRGFSGGTRVTEASVRRVDDVVAAHWSNPRKGGMPRGVGSYAAKKHNRFGATRP